MSKFSKGDKVINSETQEKGFIIEVFPPRRGRQLYKVKYEDRENDELSTCLLPDVDLTDPFERCRQNYYDHYTEYLKGNTAFKIRSSNNSTISSLKASRTLFKPYQFKPLLKFLNSDKRRVFIADEVGLGKTIEAGHIMLELKARGEFRNALVVCPVSLRAKWTTELNDKFGLEFVEIVKKEQLLQEMQHHNGMVRAVINYDKIRNTSEILQYIEEKHFKFSIIVCDESHKLRNDDTGIYRGAARLMQYAGSAVFMSATPIMLTETNLYNQLHLLDPEVYDNREVFLNNLHLNRPFVHALSQLNSGVDLPTIAQELSTSMVVTHNDINDIITQHNFLVDKYFRDYPIYQQIMQLLNSGEDNAALRAKLQYNLSEMSPMNAIFSRTRKREVTQDWTQAERNPNTEYVSLSDAERTAYNESVAQYIELHKLNIEDDETYGKEFDEEYNEVNSWGQYGLGLVSVRRQLASSVWAYKNGEGNLDQGIDTFRDCSDAKFDALLRILQTVFSHGNKKIIVFAIFKKTLKYLKIRLTQAGYKCAIIYGDTKINKYDILMQFQHDDTIQVLLSSEVGSEGLDMQFCNSMVNYDLPWNPMVVEQRIGRIDRFGQESKKVNIYNLVVNASILESIYSRLLMRIGIFRSSIGDLEAILDSEFEQNGQRVTIQDALKTIEHDFYSDKLTEEEVERKHMEIERAIENEKVNLQKIEEGLTNTLTNDSYFRNEINKIVHNNAYVTSHELLQFVLQLIKEHLTTCNLRSTAEDGVYELLLPKSDPDVLRRFLQRYEPVDNDNQLIFSRYLNQIQGELVLPLTFDQDKAFHEKRLTFVNIYHPIIQAGVTYFEKQRNKAQCTFFFELPSARLPQEIGPGRYMLAIYRVSVSKNLFDKTVVTDSLYPVLFDISGGHIVSNHELAEQFMGRAQVDGRYAPLDDNFRLDAEMVEDLRYDLKDSIDRYVSRYRQDLQTRIDNSQQLRSQQTRQYYEARIRRCEDDILFQEYKKLWAENLDDKNQKSIDKTIKLMKARLRSLKKELRENLEKINRDVQLRVTEEIESLNLVHVI